ncbi:hypothetical protein BKA62DRAFT_818110 [Auriculariales sp. MPI-PUGE-AT-0066]|nr:hypothetical protein BKA62DRAFT_818110 [Auriculariales sp. MPI-PUGE-AT-0066]
MTTHKRSNARYPNFPRFPDVVIVGDYKRLFGLPTAGANVNAVKEVQGIPVDEVLSKAGHALQNIKEPIRRTVDENNAARATFSHPDFDFFERLERCTVTKITHYRSKSRQAHELVVLEMTYRGDDGIEETRLFRLDRFRIDFLMGSERRAPRGWTKLSYKMLRAALQSSDRHDSVTVSDRLTGRTGGVITEDHRIVREFDIPRGKVSLLEALVIADTLHASTLEYSNLVHICQLWTVNFFNIVKAVVNGRVQRGVSVRDGPAAAQAGTAHNLKLVDTTTGRASLELLQATDKRLQNLNQQS